jgi:uncharacterized protein (TIGR02118 family)
MIAAISLIRRRPDVSPTQFRRHWLDVHGPLVCRFAGLQRYVQCHVLDSPVMNAAARAMDLDGFPILFFDQDAARAQAQGSPEMAACNEDSRLFIGAVSRVGTEAETVVPLAPARSPVCLMAFSPSGQDIDVAAFRDLPRLRGMVHYHVGKQGRAPNSTITHLPVAIGGAAQVWFDSVVDLEEALAGWRVPEPALFVVEEHWLIPRHLDLSLREAIATRQSSSDGR